MDQKTLQHILYAVYCSGGPSKVYELVNIINSHYKQNNIDDLIEFSECFDCGAETPNYKNNVCFVCGQ